MKIWPIKSLDQLGRTRRGPGKARNRCETKNGAMNGLAVLNYSAKSPIAITRFRKMSNPSHYDLGSGSGNLNAINSAGNPGPAIERTMYCFPFKV